LTTQHNTLTTHQIKSNLFDALKKDVTRFLQPQALGQKRPVEELEGVVTFVHLHGATEVTECLIDE
jgi:hypothetical protein